MPHVLNLKPLPLCKQVLHACNVACSVLTGPDELEVAHHPSCMPSRPREVEAQLPAPVMACIQAEAGTPFDLARGPLVRAVLIRLAPQDHLLLLIMHHTVADGWSFKVRGALCGALHA